MKETVCVYLILSISETYYPITMCNNNENLSDITDVIY